MDDQRHVTREPEPQDCPTCLHDAADKHYVQASGRSTEDDLSMRGSISIASTSPTLDSRMSLPNPTRALIGSIQWKSPES